MRGSGRLILILLTVLVVLQLGKTAVIQSYDGPGALTVSKDIYIPPGGIRAVAERLKREGVIEYPIIFRIAAYITRDQGPIRSGEFHFIAHGSLRSILHTLRNAPEVEHKATVVEGLTSVQIAAIINALPHATGHIDPPREGSVLPQTYDYTWGTKRTALLARMQKAMTRALDAAWAGRADGLPVTTKQQALTLASIVQLESPLASELPKIAGVYENRLRKKMKLQADPTVIYAVTGGRATALTHRVDDRDLATESPYNTYLHHGLPPGPICSPGITAIDAVLHPADTKALYFVADGKGGHVFSRSFKEQLANIARYRAVRRAAAAEATTAK